MLIILYFFSLIFRTHLRVAKKKNKQCFNEAFDRLKKVLRKWPLGVDRFLSLLLVEAILGTLQDKLMY